MKNPLPQTRILDTITLILVFGSLVLAAIDPSTRSAFGNLTKVVVVAYIGIHIPPSNKRGR
jgi:hypothetical protein